MCAYRSAISVVDFFVFNKVIIKGSSDQAIFSVDPTVEIKIFKEIAKEWLWEHIKQNQMLKTLFLIVNNTIIIRIIHPSWTVKRILRSHNHTHEETRTQAWLASW